MDALQLMAEDKFDMTLGDIRRDIESYPENTRIEQIWDKMLATKEQIAVIINEYGSFQGIISMEDIIETILGLEIIDENDQAIDMQQFARERWERRQKRFKPIVLPSESAESTD